MQIATFAAIDIGTYDVFLEIFEIPESSESKALTKIRTESSWERIRIPTEKSVLSWRKSSARFWKILSGLWTDIRWTPIGQWLQAPSGGAEQSVYHRKNPPADRA